MDGEPGVIRLDPGAGMRPDSGIAGRPDSRLIGLGRRAARQYGWLMLDQAVFAVTNLILNILFAHWLTPVEYGRFGITFSGFILLSVLHWYVVVEPLLVESSRIGPDRLRCYVTTLIRAHLILLAVVSVVSLAAWTAGRLVGAPDIGDGVALALGCGCALLALATARRLCLAFLSAAISAVVGSCYLVAATATAWLLHASGLISWVSLWAVMGGWSLACAAVICVILLRRSHPGQQYRLRDLFRATSPFAVWGSLSAGFAWVRSDGIYLVLALTAGLPAVAQTRAIVTLNAPLTQLNSALNASWIVDFGRRGRNTHDLRRTVLHRACAYGAIAVAGVAVACLVHGWITHLAYRGKYDAGAWLMPIFLLAYALNGVEGMLTSAMKANGIFRDAYLPQMLGSVGVGVAAATLIPFAGASGAAVAVLVGAVVGVAIATFMFRRGCAPDV